MSADLKSIWPTSPQRDSNACKNPRVKKIFSRRLAIFIEVSDHVIQLPDRMLKCGKMESNEKFIRVQPAKCSAVTPTITI